MLVVSASKFALLGANYDFGREYVLLHTAQKEEGQLKDS